MYPPDNCLGRVAAFRIDQESDTLEGIQLAQDYTREHGTDKDRGRGLQGPQNGFVVMVARDEYGLWVRINTGEIDPDNVSQLKAHVCKDFSYALNGTSP
ncbi:MAG: hypothetical protein WC773_01720 [Patescibacteria group bacterium]